MPRSYKGEGANSVRGFPDLKATVKGILTSCELPLDHSTLVFTPEHPSVRPTKDRNDLAQRSPLLQDIPFLTMDSIIDFSLFFPLVLTLLLSDAKS